LLFLVFVRCLFKGPSPRLYLAAFFITSWLELVGTYLGTWRWVMIDPASGLAQGNPPSGVAAWYCLVDAVAIGGAPKVVGLTTLLSERLWKTLKTAPNGKARLQRSLSMSMKRPGFAVLVQALCL
jgi:hypothetical protein